MPGPGFKPATSEVEGEHSNGYTTEPPCHDMLTLNSQYWVSESGYKCTVYNTKTWTPKHTAKWWRLNTVTVLLRLQTLFFLLKHNVSVFLIELVAVVCGNLTEQRDQDGEKDCLQISVTHRVVKLSMTNSNQFLAGDKHSNQWPSQVPKYRGLVIQDIIQSIQSD